MKILKILNGNDDGGVFTCEIQYIKEIRENGGCVDAIIVGQGKAYQEYKKMVDFHIDIPQLHAVFAGSMFKVLSAIIESRKFGKKYSIELLSVFKDKEYDALIYRRANYIFLAGYLSRGLKISAYWHMTNVVSNKFAYIFYNTFCKQFNIRPIANSEYTKNTIGNICKDVVYPGFDIGRVVKTTSFFREKLSIEEGIPVYGIAARLHFEKAQDIVVEAFVNSEIPKNGGHLIIAGGPLDTEYAEKIKKKAAGLLDKQVHFLGRINNLPEFYSSVDVIINGRRNAEPFGISIAEAFGAGRPVIAYKPGGPMEMIDHKENGWLVETPDLTNYTNILNVSLQDRKQWEVMGENARKKSIKYTVYENVKKLEKIVMKKED